MATSVNTVRFSRKFQIWSYSVSHSQLLLRSPKEDSAENTRVDLLFKNVGWINLPSILDDVIVSEISISEAGSVIAGIDSHLLRTRKLISLKSSTSVGFVIAGAFVWREDTGEYFEPSPLLQPPSS